MPTAFSVNTVERKTERYWSNTGCRTASKVDGGLFYRGKKSYRVPARETVIEQIKQGFFQLERENGLEAGFHLSELKS